MLVPAAAGAQNVMDYPNVSPPPGSAIEEAVAVFFNWGDEEFKTGKIDISGLDVRLDGVPVELKSNDYLQISRFQTDPIFTVRLFLGSLSGKTGVLHINIPEGLITSAGGRTNPEINLGYYLGSPTGAIKWSVANDAVLVMGEAAVYASWEEEIADHIVPVPPVSPQLFNIGEDGETLTTADAYSLLGIEEGRLKVDLSSLKEGFYRIYMPAGTVIMESGRPNNECSLNFEIEDFSWIAERYILTPYTVTPAHGTVADTLTTIEVEWEDTPLTTGEFDLSSLRVLLDNDPVTFGLADEFLVEEVNLNPVSRKWVARLKFFTFNKKTGRVDVIFPEGVIKDQGGKVNQEFGFTYFLCTGGGTPVWHPSSGSLPQGEATVYADWNSATVGVNSITPSEAFVEGVESASGNAVKTGVTDKMIAENGRLKVDLSSLAIGSYRLVIPYGAVFLAHNTTNEDCSFEFDIIKNTGIDDIENDAEEVYRVYNLQGIRVAEGDSSVLRMLSPGLYIVNGRKIFVGGGLSPCGW